MFKPSAGAAAAKIFIYEVTHVHVACGIMPSAVAAELFAQFACTAITDLLLDKCVILQMYGVPSLYANGAA